ncbi:MAG: YciK family oxidoreductase [Pseudomonadales bacterium]|nr:YciK family oxidoreductase [Pseudomonadales bacterium]
MSQYQPRANLLAGKNIMVTGAGSGIGRAAALAYANFGATVILLGKTESKLESVYDEIEARGGQQPALVAFDLDHTEPAAYANIATELGGSFGQLHGLLHNAGILGQLVPLQQYDAQLFSRVLDVNLLSNFLLTQAMLPALQAAEHASIVFTSSSVGRRGRAYWGAYAVAKFGVEGLMQVWADELESTSKVRVNSLNPCGTNTPMRRQAYPAEAPGSCPEADAIMGAYLYLMGDDSLAVNGQALDARPR